MATNAKIIGLNHYLSLPRRLPDDPEATYVMSVEKDATTTKLALSYKDVGKVATFLGVMPTELSGTVFGMEQPEPAYWLAEIINSVEPNRGFLPTVQEQVRRTAAKHLARGQSPSFGCYTDTFIRQAFAQLWQDNKLSLPAVLVWCNQVSQYSGGTVHLRLMNQSRQADCQRRHPEIEGSVIWFELFVEGQPKLLTVRPNHQPIEFVVERTARS